MGGHFAHLAAFPSFTQLVLAQGVRPHSLDSGEVLGAVGKKVDEVPLCLHCNCTLGPCVIWALPKILLQCHHSKAGSPVGPGFPC